MSMRFFAIPMHSVTLAKADIFLPAFLKMSEIKNVRQIQQVENTTFNNDVDVTNKCKLMKDCVKNANVRFSKDKSSNYQSSSKLINDDTKEEFALITEKINIQLMTSDRNREGGFMNQKKKWTKHSH